MYYSVPKNERIYVEELETMLGVTFRKTKAEMKGKGQDGITEAQKKYLHGLGINVTGIRYKGEAHQIIKLICDRQKLGLPSIDALKHGAHDPIYKGTIYRVKKLGANITLSPELFSSVTDAEYYIGRRVKPEWDVEIIKFKPKCIWVVENKNGFRYFPSRENAEFIQSRVGGTVVRYVCM